MSNTPETDKQAMQMPMKADAQSPSGWCSVVRTSFAREQEKTISRLRAENAALQAKLESETSISDELLKLNTEHCKEKAALRADAATLCAIIDHANPGAWSNGNTHPDGHGPDEGEVLMSNLYSPLRAKYARAAHGADEENST